MYSTLFLKIPMISRLAWRSIWRQRRRTLITMTSIGVGLAVAIFSISLGEGVYSQMVDDGVRMQAGHITLEHPEYAAAPAVDLWIEGVDGLRGSIERMESVDATKLLVLGQGVAKSASGAIGAAVMGVEPEVERETSPLARRIVKGGYLDKKDERMAVVGVKLAERLDLDTGKKLVFTTNNVGGELVQELCRVKGIFRTGSDEIDGFIVQIPIDFARRLFGLKKDQATQLGVVLRESGAQARTLKAIRDLIRDLKKEREISVLPWQQVMPEVAAYIRTDRASNWVFQGLLLVIILFTILNTLLMSVVERDREFAVLLALGTPSGQLKGQLMVESAYVGLLGCVLGLALGGVASLAMEIWGLDLGFFLPEGMTVSGLAISTKIHARLTVSILLATGGIVLGSTLFLALFPMRRITRVRLAETLR